MVEKESPAHVQARVTALVYKLGTSRCLAMKLPLFSFLHYPSSVLSSPERVKRESAIIRISVDVDTKTRVRQSCLCYVSYPEHQLIPPLKLVLA